MTTATGRVWIAIPRAGITYHAPAERGQTECGRGMTHGRGLQLDLDQALTDYRATPCSDCYPELAP